MFGTTEDAKYHQTKQEGKRRDSECCWNTSNNLLLYERPGTLEGTVLTRFTAGVLNIREFLR